MASTIKVDNVQNQPGTNIINKCGTTTTIGAGAGETINVCAATVNIGRCGGTVALAAGATQTGFGRTGTVDWQTTPKTTGTFTAVSGEGYFLNTSGGVITANLPAGVAGAIVSFADYAATWQTSNVTVTPNGTDKIGALNQNATLNVEGQSVTFVYVDSTQGWINTMDSTSNVRGNPFMVATVSGACNTLVTAPCCANVKIATFTGPGSFAVTNASATAAENIVSYMVLAGGAGGGGCMGGGGGAGGFREIKSPLTPYTASPLDGYATPANHVTVTATGYPIVVGGGGTVGGTSPGSPTTTDSGAGNSSSFSTVTSAGGGGGRGGPCNGNVGVAGGSGSGGSGGIGSPNAGGAGNTPPVTPSQGNPGGTATTFPLPGSPEAYSSAGGGGAGGAGANAQPGPRAGGVGIATSITASPVTYSAGGGGGLYNPPVVPGTNQLANTGNGGPAGTGDAAATTGGLGGSGIVIIRYKFQ